MRPITGIIVHCTATRPNWWEDRTSEEKAEECRRWHVEDNGWSDIGYHYLIDRDGTVTPGRPMGRAGAHVKGHNANTVGIALWGGHGSTKNDQFSDHFTSEQNTALRQLILDLRAAHGDIPVSGHNEYANKACPGFNARKWFAREPERTTPAQSTTIQASTVTGAVSAGTGLLAALSDMDPLVQAILAGGAVVALLGVAWVVRERLRKWAEGDR